VTPWALRQAVSLARSAAKLLVPPAEAVVVVEGVVVDVVVEVVLEFVVDPDELAFELEPHAAMLRQATAARTVIAAYRCAPCSVFTVFLSRWCFWYQAARTAN
jgi:hypothetical protein